MSRTGVWAVILAVGLAGLAVPALGETYYVEQDESSVSANIDVSFSTSGYLKLVIFDPNGILDWLNPRADAMAGIYADALAPDGFTTEEWCDPIDVRALSGLCEPVEEPWGCGVRERQALEVGFWDSRAVVFDGNYAYAGFMDLVLLQVGEAWRYTELWCEDAPEAWYSAVFVFHMEG